MPVTTDPWRGYEICCEIGNIKLETRDSVEEMKKKRDELLSFYLENKAAFSLRTKFDFAKALDLTNEHIAAWEDLHIQYIEPGETK